MSLEHPDAKPITSQWTVAMIRAKTGRSERSDLSKTEKSERSDLSKTERSERMAWNDLLWFAMVRYGMECFIMVCHGMVLENPWDMLTNTVPTRYIAYTRIVADLK